MWDLRSASITSVLAVALTVAAFPAAAQSSSSGSTAPQGAGSTTGTLPDNSLAGQRQGTMSGGTAPQTGEKSGTAGSSTAAPTGTLPDNTLAGQRQGAIGGAPVSQGGSGSADGANEKPKQ